MFGSNRDHLQDRVESIAQDAGERLSELGRSAFDTADTVKHEAVKLLNNAADSIRYEARRSRANRDVRQNADNVARGLERAAHYLKRNSFEDMSDDMTDSVRENPWRTLAIIFIVGLIVGLILRGGDDKPHSSNGYGSAR